MGAIESLIFLLGAAALLAQFARVLKLPYPIFLVLGGVAIGFAPGLPELEVPSEVIFLVFLPLLLNAAYCTSPLDLRAACTHSPDKERSRVSVSVSLACAKHASGENMCKSSSSSQATHKRLDDIQDSGSSQTRRWI